MRKNDYIGIKFGLLTPVRELPQRVFPNGKSDRVFECDCECGNKKIVTGQNIKTGNTKSCGCLRVEITRKRTTKHGMTHSPEFRSYRHMISRCTNKNVERYPHYGGRGITICEEWLGDGGFDRFYQHIGPRPTPKHSLDRIDTDGNYKPGNVKWSLPTEQVRNRRTAIKIEHKGKQVALKEISEELSLSYHSVYLLYRKGLSAEQIFARATLQAKHSK